MYIAGPAFDGPGNQHVDQLYYRRLRGEVFKMTYILLFLVPQELNAPITHVLNNTIDILGFLLIEPLQVFVDHLSICCKNHNVG